MISFVTSLLALSADSTTPPVVEARVREAVASAWSVPAERVRLEFGRMPPVAIVPQARARLVGQGTDGWYVAVIEGGAPAAVRVRAGVDDSAGTRWGPPMAVHQGETLRFVWGKGAVQVSLEAVAFNDAPVGGKINARTSNGMRLAGKVTGPGEATLERGTP